MYGLSAISIIAASLYALLYCSETALTGLLVAQNNFATAPTNLSRYVNENAVIYLESLYVATNITWSSKLSNAYDSIALFGNIMTHGDFLNNTKFIPVPHTPEPPTKVTLASLLKDCFSKAYTMYSHGKNVREIIHDLTADDEHTNKYNTNHETIASTYLCYRKNDYDAAICVHTTPRNYHIPWKSQMKSSIESALDSFFSGLLFDKRQAIQPAPEPIKPITLRMVLSKMVRDLNADHIRKIGWLMIAVFIAGIVSIKSRRRTVTVDHNNDDNKDDELRESNNEDVDPQEPTSGELDNDNNANDDESQELDAEDADPQEPTSKELKTEREAFTSNMTDDLLKDEDESSPLSETSENQRSTQDDDIKECTDTLFTSAISSAPLEYSQIADAISELENMRFVCEHLNESSNERAFIITIARMDQKVCDSNKQLQKIAAVMQQQWHLTMGLKRKSLEMASDLGDSRLKQLCYLFYRFIKIYNVSYKNPLKLSDFPVLLDSMKAHDLAKGDLSKKPAEIMSNMETELTKVNLSCSTTEAELEYLDSVWEISKSFNLDQAHFQCSDVSYYFHDFLKQRQCPNKTLGSKERIQILGSIYNRFVYLEKPFTQSLRHVSEQIQRIQTLICDISAAYENFITQATPIVRISDKNPRKFTKEGLTEVLSSIDSSRQLENLFRGLLNEA